AARIREEEMGAAASPISIGAANQIGERGVFRLPGLMIAVSLMDSGVEIIENGEVIYRCSLKKVKELLPILVEEYGAKMVYLYGGFYELSNLSTKVHTCPDKNPNLVKSQDNRAYVMVGYQCKSVRLTISKGEVLLNDRFGNSFSHKGMLKDVEDPDSELRLNPLLSDTDALQDLKDTIQEAKRLGLDIFVDIIPWVSPDAIGSKEEKGMIPYQWTIHRDLASYGIGEGFDSWKEEEKEDFIKKILNEKNNDNGYKYPEFAAVRVKEQDKEKVVLVRRFRFYGLDSADQVVLNIFLREVQEYLINTIKRLVDLGITGVRVDQAGRLLKKDFLRTYGYLFAQDEINTLESWRSESGYGLHEEPLGYIISKAKGYAKAQGKEIKILAEAYNGEHTPLAGLGVDMLYYENLYKDFMKLAREVNPTNIHHLTKTIEHAIKNRPNLLVYISNYDEFSGCYIGGPLEQMRMFLVPSAYMGVPVMVDLREIMGHGGQAITIPGGIEPDGTYRHAFVATQELEERMDFAGIKKLVENGPFVRLIQHFFANVHTDKVIKPELRSSEDGLSLILTWETEKVDLKNEQVWAVEEWIDFRPYVTQFVEVPYAEFQAAKEGRLKRIDSLDSSVETPMEFKEQDGKYCLGSVGIPGKIYYKVKPLPADRKLKALGIEINSIRITPECVGCAYFECYQGEPFFV
ncbi:MAG: hypothetical protein WAX79_09245, partial [Candidatus Omnitrophota bacterium]